MRDKRPVSNNTYDLRITSNVHCLNLLLSPEPLVQAKLRDVLASDNAERNLPNQSTWAHMEHVP